jgi:hypothetical protein
VKGIGGLYSFPDSLGDDLIVEVLDSKGKYYGRVLAQVASIAEDSVIFSEYLSKKIFKLG